MISAEALRKLWVVSLSVMIAVQMGCYDDKLKWVSEDTDHEVLPSDGQDDPFVPEETDPEACILETAAETAAPQSRDLFVAYPPIVDGDRLFFLTDIELGIYDISSPTAPRMVHGIRDDFYRGYGLAVAGDDIFVFDETLAGVTEVHLYSYAGRNADPRKIDSWFPDFEICGFATISSYLLLSACDGEYEESLPIYVYQTADLMTAPDLAVPIQTANVGDGQVTSLHVFGDTMFGQFVATGYVMTRYAAAFDVSAVPAVSTIAMTEIPAYLGAVTADENSVWIALNGDAEDELQLYDFNPAGTLSPAASADTVDEDLTYYNIYSMLRLGNRLYITEGIIGGLINVYDISTPASPVRIFGTLDYIFADRIVLNRSFDDGMIYAANTETLRVISPCEP
jgi:hypothetical protein